MTWTDRIIEVTGWQAAPAQADGDWSETESTLGVALPADFKELSQRFGAGTFSAFLQLVRPAGESDPASLLSNWKAYQQFAGALDPYGLYDPGTGTGLIRWATDQTEGEYYWLADRSVAPEQWPVIARKDSAAPWRRFEMTATEVVFRVLADPEFQPFTVADPPRLAFFLPQGRTISSAEEWEALTNPDRRS